MGTHLGHNFSGIVINQNNPRNTELDWLAAPYLGRWIYQTFTLPRDYQRGHKIHRPDLSGFQVYVDISTRRSSAASLNWVLEYYDNEWISLTSGVTIGAPTTGTLWFDVIFPETISVTEAIAEKQFRIGIALPNGATITGLVNQPLSIIDSTHVVVDDKSWNIPTVEGSPFLITIDGFPAFIIKQNGEVTYSYEEGITSLWYSAPAPNAKFEAGPAYQSDGFTPLVAGQTVALNFRVLSLVADHGRTFLGNEYRSAVVETPPGNVDTGGGDTGSGVTPVTGSGQSPYWMSPPLPSKFAVQSLYFDIRNAANGPVVIDGVLIDPVTPNMACNVYYSQDDQGTSDNMTEIDWEQKLWNHVPKSFILLERKRYALPQPVMTKYIKIEFTNLQAQAYDPGPFTFPTTYKKFPTWVANFFIALLSAPEFITNQVDVNYDALRFAYDYFLDDLNQRPEAPVAPPTDALAQLTNYFITNAKTGVDPATLGKINLIMKQFQREPQNNVNEMTMIGKLIAGIYDDPSTNLLSTTEGNNLSSLDLSTVSTINREPIVFEQLIPAMYFFIPCRHTYKEVSAGFDHNRAYFAGINDIAFLRENYTVAADTPFYIETGGDNANIERSDFVFDNDLNVWFTY